MKQIQPKRKSNKLHTFLRVLLSILILASSALLLAELYMINILTPVLFIAAAVLVGLTDIVLIIFLNFKTRKPAARTVVTILCVALVAVYGTGSWYLDKTYDVLGKLSETNRTKNVIEVIAMNDTGIETLQDLNGDPVGILEGINESGTQRILSDIESQGVNITTESFKNFGPLADALYNGQVDAIIINQTYWDNIAGLEKFSDFSERTRIVYTFEYETGSVSSSKPVANITSKPFTVMMNGSDSRGGLGDTDRSDVNMLVTINPVTHVVLMTSIPRDSYVETVCDPEYECLQGQYDKLTHTGMHTYNTTKKTIENLLGVDINYTFRANFSAVVDIVDALGGIEVNVAPGYAVDYFYTNDMFGTNYGVHEGINQLNGQAALCYARERYAYTEGDFQRIKNQQEVLQAIAKKATSPSVITSYPRLLDTIDGNFWTDLSTNEITDLIKYQIAKNPDWDFISYSLSGEPDTAYCAESYSNASVVILDQNTVRFAKKLIDGVLAGDDAATLNEMIEEQAAAGLTPDYGTIDYGGQYYTDPGTYYEPVPEYNDNSWQEPSYQEPAWQQPSWQEPVYQEPSYQEPVVPETPVTPPVTEPVTPDPTPVVPVTPSEPDPGVADPVPGAETEG